MKNGRTRLALLASAAAVFGLAVRVYTRRRKRIDFAGRTVVVSGGSRGLGLVLARMLAAEGARLALLARSESELRNAERELLACSTDVIAVPCDLREPEQIRQAVERIVSRFGRIDAWINVAGVIQVGPQEHLTLSEYREAMDVHFWGPLRAIREVVPHMRQMGGGRIVNVTSIGGKVAVPHLAPYVASKFALTGLSATLRAELAPYHIDVTTVAPGLMRTGSHVNAFFKGRQSEEYTWFSISNALPLFSTSAESAARQIVSALRYARADLTITPQARLLVLFEALFPGLYAAVARLANRLLPAPEPRFGDLLKTGWESQSRWSPSRLTTLADRAVFENNEVRSPQSPARMPEGRK